MLSGHSIYNKMSTLLIPRIYWERSIGSTLYYLNTKIDPAGRDYEWEETEGPWTTPHIKPYESPSCRSLQAVFFFCPKLIFTYYLYFRKVRRSMKLHRDLIPSKYLSVCGLGLVKRGVFLTNKNSHDTVLRNSDVTPYNSLSRTPVTRTKGPTFPSPVPVPVIINIRTRQWISTHSNLFQNWKDTKLKE